MHIERKYHITDLEVLIELETLYSKLHNSRVKIGFNDIKIIHKQQDPMLSHSKCLIKLFQQYFYLS